LEQEKLLSFGRDIAFELAKNLSNNKIVVVSGLASGVDECAHKGAIKSTIAVLAGGFNEILKGEKLVLANKILDNDGLLLSEYPINKPVLSFQFLERNRIISALSKVVIITEAPIKSGAMNTAHHAIEQNKKLFVVPWNLDYFKGAGGISLFLKNASPLVDYMQVVNYIYPPPKQLRIEDIFTPNYNNNVSPNIDDIPEEYRAYFEYIKENSPTSIQDIINFFNDKCIADITSDLSLMELDGYVKMIDDKYKI